MASEDYQRQSSRYRRHVGVGLVAAVLVAIWVGIFLTGQDNTPRAASQTSPQPSTEAGPTSTTLDVRTEVVERLRAILRIRDRAFRERNPKILEDIYTADCPCLEGDKNAIQELLDNNYHLVGGATSIEVQSVSRVNKRLWLVVADFQSSPLRIQTEDSKLIREEPRGSDLFQFALSRPAGSAEWLLGRAAAYQDGSG